MKYKSLHCVRQQRRRLSPSFASFLVWNQLEVIILGADGKNRGICRREHELSVAKTHYVKAMLSFKEHSRINKHRQR